MLAFTDTEDDFVIVHRVHINDLINSTTYIDKVFFDNETTATSENYLVNLMCDITRSDYNIDCLKISTIEQFQKLKNWKQMARIFNQGAFSIPCKILHSKLKNNRYIGEMRNSSPMKINIDSRNNHATMEKRLRIFELYNTCDFTTNIVDVTIFYSDSVTIKYAIW